MQAWGRQQALGLRLGAQTRGPGAPWPDFLDILGQRHRQGNHPSCLSECQHCCGFCCPLLRKKNPSNAVLTDMAFGRKTAGPAVLHNNGNSVFLQRLFHPERLRRETEQHRARLSGCWCGGGRGGGGWRDRCRRDPGPHGKTPRRPLLPPLLLGSALGRLVDTEQVSWHLGPQFLHL